MKLEKIQHKKWLFKKSIDFLNSLCFSMGIGKTRIKTCFDAVFQSFLTSHPYFNLFGLLTYISKNAAVNIKNMSVYGI